MILAEFIRDRRCSYEGYEVISKFKDQVTGVRRSVREEEEWFKRSGYCFVVSEGT